MDTWTFITAAAIAVDRPQCSTYGPTDGAQQPFNGARELSGSPLNQLQHPHAVRLMTGAARMKLGACIPHCCLGCLKTCLLLYTCNLVLCQAVSWRWSVGTVGRGTWR